MRTMQSQPCTAAGSYPAHFVLRGGAGVDEGLRDDRQDGVDAVGHLNVQNKLRVLQDVHPEPERETAGGGDRRVRGTESPGVPLTWFSPVGLPDVDRLRVVDAVLLRHVVQEVKEESDGNRRRTLGAEDGHKDVVHELLQRPLEEGGRVGD